MSGKQHQMHISLDMLQTPASGECVVDAFWMVHPDKGALYTLDEHQARHTDCVREAYNYDTRVVKMFLQPDHEIVQIPIAYLAHGRRAASDFCARVLAAREAERQSA
jgi:hypothetical protein